MFLVELGFERRALGCQNKCPSTSDGRTMKNHREKNEPVTSTPDSLETEIGRGLRVKAQ
jgi:hypothetical protein